MHILRIKSANVDLNGGFYASHPLTVLRYIIKIFLIFVAGQTTRTNIERATIVKDSTNVTIAKKAEVYHVHQNDDKRQTTDNFKGTTNLFLPSDEHLVRIP